jgi:hypothetical protein
MDMDKCTNCGHQANVANSAISGIAWCSNCHTYSRFLLSPETQLLLSAKALVRRHCSNVRTMRPFDHLLLAQAEDVDNVCELAHTESVTTGKPVVTFWVQTHDGSSRAGKPPRGRLARGVVCVCWPDGQQIIFSALLGTRAQQFWSQSVRCIRQS